MATKDIAGNNRDNEYHLLQDHKIKTSPNKYEKLRKEIKETSPIIMENTIRNEETLRKLWIVSGICLIFMFIEVIGGYLANSIAIMSDAAHLLSDFLGFIISIVSIYISRRGATHQMSFGYHRAEVIGALVSVNLIWGLTMWLFYEATLRIIHTREVNGLIMLVVAVIGFVFNVVMGLILAYQGIDHNLHHHHDHGEDGHDHAHELSHTKIKRSLSTVGKIPEKADKNLPKLKHPETSKNINEHDMNHNHEHDEEHDHDEDHDHDHENTGVNKDEHDLQHKHVHKFENHTHKKHIHHDQKHEKTHVHKTAPQEFKEKHKRFSSEGEHDHDHDEDDQHDEHDGHNHDHQNVNLRAALIHVIGDAVQNLGVVIAGLVIYFYPEASIADPICTFIFSFIVIFTTIRILRDCIAVLMEGSPIEFDMVTLETDLYNIRGVVEVHDLHVWSLSIGKLSLSCHLTSNNPQISLKKARKLIKQKYKITHSTIQVELEFDKDNEDCKHDLHHEVNNLNRIA